MQRTNPGFPQGITRHITSGITRRFAPGIAALLLAACTAIGPAYQTPPPPADGYATIVIYRESRLRSSAWPSKWYVDEQQAISIYGNGYASFQVGAGVHRLHSAEKFADSGLRIHTRFDAGRIYFFKLDIVERGSAVVSSITGIEPSIANEELKTYRMSEPLRARIE